ncbi:hypothetical protein PSEWESI4_02952 [Pseudomonas carbonaria]|uniref:Uncharacterized protein n=1 Tax=Zestomonas carbonaria TaxID=2762745 RepID=A0A7U7EPD6_9GAMM|nr:hypothetical protein PSEWESI4_02952 [Pseudomonas carbonaria]
MRFAAMGRSYGNGACKARGIASLNPFPPRPTVGARHARDRGHGPLLRVDAQLNNPSALARATAWVRRSTPSLLLMWRAWVFTVCREMNS